MMCRIVVRVTFIKMYLSMMSYFDKSYIHKNILIDDVSYCGKSYIHRKCIDR